MRILSGILLFMGDTADKVRQGELDRALEDLGMAAKLPATADEASLLTAQVLIYLPAAYLALGVFYLQKGDAERAEPPLRIALEMAENPSMAMLFLERLDDKARSYIPDPRQEKSGTAAELLSQRPYFVPARLRLIDNAEDRDDHWQAMRHYRQLLHWLPGLPVFLARRAQLAHTMGASILAEQSSRSAREPPP
jgi:tetratricopeptide (TPR) repeat protein